MSCITSQDNQCVERSCEPVKSKEGNDQESIQPNATPDLGNHMEV